MSGCAEFEALMEEMMAEEGASPLDRTRLAGHAGGCQRCGDLYGFHTWLSREAPGLEEPSRDEFSAMRRGVLDGLRAESARPEAAPWWEVLRSPLTLRPIALAAVAALLLAAGWVLGGALAPAGNPVETPLSASGGESSEDLLRNLESTPYLFSNVSVESAEEGEVNLSFDMTRRVSLHRDRNDPMVREALMQSMRDSQVLGDRLKAVSVAGDLMDPAIRETLLSVMENDPSMAVRLKALETLTRYPSDPEVHLAMLNVLQHEESVAMRLQAIDYLGSSQVGSERILTALEGAQGDGSRAVLIRARERLGL